VGKGYEALALAGHGGHCRGVLARQGEERVEVPSGVFGLGAELERAGGLASASLLLALSRAIWAHQFGGLGLFSTPKLTNGLFSTPKLTNV